jgi:hypothetical protein
MHKGWLFAQLRLSLVQMVLLNDMWVPDAS